VLGFAELVVAAVVFAAVRIPWLARLLVPAPLARHAVERRAHEEFFGRGLFRTRERTAVLIFLSELEHRVVILGDEGIHARVETQGWQRHVDRIVQAIREGRAAEGVCAVIVELASVLERAVPRRKDDTNELPDTVQEDSA